MKVPVLSFIVLLTLTFAVSGAEIGVAFPLMAVAVIATRRTLTIQVDQLDYNNDDDSLRLLLSADLVPAETDDGRRKMQVWHDRKGSVEHA